MATTNPRKHFDPGVLLANLELDEAVLDVIIGDWGQVVVVTSTRVWVIKQGVLAGDAAGFWALPYRLLGYVAVRSSAMGGTFQMAKRPPPQHVGWGRSYTMPGAVPFGVTDRARFEALVDAINRRRAAGMFSPTGKEAAGRERRPLAQRVA